MSMSRRAGRRAGHADEAPETSPPVATSAGDSLGSALMVRSMVYLAAEPIPYFWPMRTFIHHNPLHGLEHLPFAEAVTVGTRLFHGRGYLPRAAYQDYLARGEVDAGDLRAGVADLLTELLPAPVRGVDVGAWVHAMLTAPGPLRLRATRATGADVHAVLAGRPLPAPVPDAAGRLEEELRREFLGECPVQQAADALFGSQIGDELDALVIKSCLDFFDEGQSGWAMPGREQGFFRAWRELALHNIPLEGHARAVRRILSTADTPEGIILHVLSELQVPQEHWIGYFTRDLARMHGWSGFIRWRSTARRYHWSKVFPGDLVDLLAIRLTLALALLTSSKNRSVAAVATGTALSRAIEERPREMYLRAEFYRGRVVPRLAATVERALARGRQAEVERVFREYVEAKRASETHRLARGLRTLARLTGQEDRLAELDADEVAALVGTLAACEKAEGGVWLEAMEATAIRRLVDGITLRPAPPQDKRPFAQAAFCIDTRSERIRRHLESVGDYQTFGIAGFFGVPVSFIELGKGSETHLSPVIVTPQNVVLEIATTAPADAPAVTVLREAVHELKASVVTPFVTVEAIGLLFGFDMVGKTLLPRAYEGWRARVRAQRTSDGSRTHLLLDKLDRAQADSIVRAVQRGVIVEALKQELGLDPETVNDAMVRELREAALGHEGDLKECLARLDVPEEEVRRLVVRLQTDYEINTSFARLQLERLGRIGFTLDEQVTYTGQALRSIGLTGNFSRFVLLTGHGSTSANNPYESALDCGACGGNHGHVSARVLAQMANKPQVRRRLRDQGIEIPDDTWFLPAMHNTTTDEVQLFDLELIPAAHLVYIDRLRQGLTAASRLCAQERIPTLGLDFYQDDRRSSAPARAQRNSMDWSQVRPEWGLSRNAYFIIGPRDLTRECDLAGRAFLHSYDYRIDPTRRLLENLLAGPLVVGQWINMEHYFSTVDNQCYGSGSKVSHNVSGRFGVMTGNISDLRTGLPAQTVLKDGKPYHDPIRLITVIEAPFEHACAAVEAVISVRQLVTNAWVRLLVVDPTTGTLHLFHHGKWRIEGQLAPAGETDLHIDATGRT
jgi:uncharacterized protein YbcC (UPF0753/DUF2309 family)